jgi:hypothetical protein
MEEIELRVAIYERLGLEFGSLPSESGNDWQRAKDEVLEENRQIEFEKLQQLKKIDYTKVDKESDEYKTVMNSKSLQMQVFYITISSRSDLSNDDINKLFQIGNKDILINLAKNVNLSELNINEIIEKGTYLARKNLVNSRELTAEQKLLLLDKMKEHKNLYSDLIDLIK